MSMPTLTVTGQEIYDGIAPLMTSDVPGYSDADNGFVGAILSGAFATMLDPVASVVRLDNNPAAPGFASIFDVDTVDASWLPWVAQFLGDGAAVQAASGNAALQRAIIKTPQNFTRGRPNAIISAVKATLTGTQTVLFNAFNGGVWYSLNVATFTSETPNTTATLNALMSLMPAWMVVTYSTVTGGTYATLHASHASYSAMEAAHTHYSDIPVNPAA